MEINVQSIRFEAGEKLQDYIRKRVSKLTRFGGNIMRAEVSLKDGKPESSTNKEATIRLTVPGGELYAEKTGNSFEEAVDLCAESLVRQLEKRKDKEMQKNR